VVLGIASVLLAKTIRSSTFRRALIWIAIFGAVVLALFGYVYRSTTSYVLSRSDRTIEAEYAELHRAYEIAGRSGLIAAIARGIADDRSEGWLYLLADPAFTPVAGNLKTWPSELRGVKGWDNFGARAWKPEAKDGPLLRATFETLPDGYHLLVGKDIGDLDEFARKINTALAMVLSLIFVLAAAASISVTRRTVARIEAINTTSRAIMHSGLGKRIPVHGTRDEWDQLAENLNLMLDRIETLMGEVKQVTDNVAHELRTPLTRMRARLEKAGGGQCDADHHQPLINDTIMDLDVVLHMFSSLTRLSQIETSDRRAAFRTVDLTEIASDVAELFDAAAEENDGHLSLVRHQRVFVTGDRDLLFDAVANLVDNAIKHGREAGQVTVEVAHRNGEAFIAVSDNGPGIPANEHPHVFKRFYRLERSRHVPGNGLGLSIVAAVARLHGARIEMLDNSPGLKFRLRFPEPVNSSVEAECVRATDANAR
jgi:signal transduction histidine kinase